MGKIFIDNYHIFNWNEFWIGAGRKLELNLRLGLRGAIFCYQVAGAMMFGGQCRFHPTCSAYAQQVLRDQALLRALGMIFKRLWNCRPGGGFGIDLAPPVVKRGYAKE